jgi:hypothetical protein
MLSSIYSGRSAPGSDSIFSGHANNYVAFYDLGAQRCVAEGLAGSALNLLQGVRVSTLNFLPLDAQLAQLLLEPRLFGRRAQGAADPVVRHSEFFGSCCARAGSL